MKKSLLLLNPASLSTLIDLYIEESADDSLIDLSELSQLISNKRDSIKILEAGIKLGLSKSTAFGQLQK